MKDRLKTRKRGRWVWGAFSIAAFYLVLGCVWILFSDQLAAQLAPSKLVLEQIGIYKGWAYVGVTALLLYWLIRQDRAVLQGSETKFRAVIEQCTEGFVITDEDGRIIEWNRATEEIWGIKYEEAIGRFFYDMQFQVLPAERRTPERYEYLKSAQLEAQRSGQSALFNRAVDGQLLRPDGRLISIRQNIFPIKTSHGYRIVSISEDISERKQFEEEVRSLSLVVEQSPLSIVITDRGGAIRYVNPKFSQVTGYTFDEARGQNPRILKSGLMAPEVYREMWQNIEAGRVWRGEFGNKKKNGELYWEDVIISPVVDKAGAITHFVAIKEDITERKQVEGQLRDSQDRYRTLFEDSPLPIWEEDFSELKRYVDGLRAEGVQDLRGYFEARPEAAQNCAGMARVVDVNRAAMAWSGSQTKQALLGKLSERLSPDGVADFVEELLALLEDGPRFTLTSRRRMPDGTYLHLIITGTIALGHEENWDRVLISILDISDRVHAEEGAQQRAEQMLLLYQMGHALTAGGDLYHALRALVKELRRLLTVDAIYVEIYDEAAGMLSFPLYLVVEQDLTVAPIRLAEQSGPTREVLTTRKTLYIPDVTDPEIQKQHSLLIRSYLGIPLMMENRIIGVMSVQARQPGAYSNEQIQLLETIASQVAITVEKSRLFERVNQELAVRIQAESEVRKLNETLELRVAERTAQLELVNKELEAFSYSVSHDLRAPLRGVEGFARILQNEYGGGLPEEAQELLAKVLAGARQMNQLIDDLLKFSRMSLQPLRKQRIDVNELAQNALRSLGTARDGRQVEITLGELPACEGDAALLLQVWVNLLSNALKYTRQRETARIEVGCTHVDGVPVYYVRDNGVGFDMQYADKLFGVFQRLHRDDEFEGTGVGLALVKNIISRHGGRIWAEAVPGDGATFFFSLA